MSSAAPPVSALPAADGLPMPRRRHATIAVLTTVLIVVLDQAIANVALPTMAATLNATPANTVWVVTAYQLALVMGILPCAAVGESLGHNRVYIGGLVLFTLASVACALSPSLGWLIAARFLQGLAAAPMMSLGIALLRFSWPHQRMGQVIGWMALVVAFGSAIGPTAGAAILSVASWPWLFAINVPIGLVVLAIRRSLPAPAATGRAIDLGSVALNAVAFAALVLGADHAVRDPVIGLPLLALSALAFTLLVLRERPRAAPLVPLDLLRNPSFRLSVTASVCCFAAQMTGYIALPFLLQHGLHQSVLVTGLCMTPWPVMVAICGPQAGKLSDRMSGAILCGIGGICLGVGLGLAALWPLGDSPWPLIPFIMLAGVGFGLFQVPNNRNMLMAVPRERSGAAGGMQGTARLLGQTVGGLIMSVLFTVLAAGSAPRLALGCGAVLAVAAGVISMLRISAGPAAGAPAMAGR